MSLNLTTKNKMIMKKLYFKQLIVAVVALLGCTMVNAHDFEMDGIFYTITSETTVEVTYNGEDYSVVENEYSGSVVIPESVTYNDVCYGVTAIGLDAFRECLEITSITLPGSITTIGAMAFRTCNALTDVYISDLVAWCNIEHASWSNPMNYAQNLYLNGELLTELVIPDSITEIKAEIFNGCNCITSVKFHDGVTTIGDYAFQNCTGLTKIIGGDGITNIGFNAFKACTALTEVTISENITSLDASAFNGCTGITKLTLNNNNLEYYEGFKSTNSLKEIIFGNSITSIENLMFRNTGIVSITLPETVTSIGDYAFENCRELENINIPEAVTTIGIYAFSGCTKLANLTIPENVTTVGFYAFDGTKWLNDHPDGAVYTGKVLYKYKGEAPDGIVNVKEGTLIIGIQAFYNCSSVTNVVIPNTVTTLEEGAFYVCESLANITIPNSVTSIGRFVFTGCFNLEQIAVEEGNPVYDSRNNCNAIIETASNTLLFGCKNTIIPSSVTNIGSAFNYTSTPTSITIPDGVKTIESNAFAYCENLTSISISASVTSIANNAFSGCYNITNIVVDEENTVYSSPDNCNAIIEIATNKLVFGCKNTVIPENITTIGSYAFMGQRGLTNVTLPKGLTTIEEFAFNSCQNLTSIEIPNSVTTIASNGFSGCKSLKSVKIGTGLTNVDQSAFALCDSITRIELNCTEVKGMGFNHLGCLEEFILGDSVKIIGEGAFSGLNIISIEIPNSVTTIGEYAFEYCTALTNVSIPNGVTKIAKWAFGGCSALASIEIPNSVTTIDESAFYACSALTSIEIPNSVTEIGRYAFRGCSALVSIEIPNSVTTIGANVFDGCTALTSISLDVENVTSETIKGASNVKEIVLGKNVASIGRSAFTSCDSLTSIYSLNETPVALKLDPFGSKLTRNATLYVPVGSLEAYRSATRWKNFVNIVEMDMTGIESAEANAPVFEITAGGIQLTAAEGKPVAVYTVGGALVEKIGSYAGEEIELNKGIYIINVGGKAVKVKL